jgi:hypothetical protein
MRILLAESMSYFDLGGAAKACRGLIEGLSQSGHSCVVVTLSFPDNEQAKIDLLSFGSRVRR